MSDTSSAGTPGPATGKRRILVTGFGPFGHHNVNASWVAVGELERLWEQRGAELGGHTLFTRQIPVAYEYVSENLPKIYEECRPDLCIHVGVSPYTNLKLERRGQNTAYMHPDIHGKSPSGCRCVEAGPDAIATRFDLDRVCRSLSGLQGGGVSFGVSEDAGRYLCDFIYYRSLHLDKCPVVFLHVPALNQPYSKEQLGQALRDLVEVLLAEVSRMAE